MKEPDGTFLTTQTPNPPPTFVKYTPLQKKKSLVINLENQLPMFGSNNCEILLHYGIVVRGGM